MKLPNVLLLAVGTALFILPVSLGLLGTWLPALGYLPGMSDGLSSQPLLAVLAHPSTWTSVKLSVSSALFVTVCSLVFSQWLCMNLYHRRIWPLLKHSIAPLLAIPHLAFAIGLVFLISPSGWLMRLLSPGITGFDIPPDWLIVNDNYALSLSIGLFLKETPFLLLMSLAAMSRFDHGKTLQIAATLKYSHRQAWRKLIFPQMYAQLRLPLFAVLSYSLSVVDVSTVLGPNTPATFAVLIHQWFNHTDISYRLLGAVGASMLLLIVVGLIAVFYAAELVVKKTTQNWLVAGPKISPKSSGFEVVLAKLSLTIMIAVTLLCIAALAVWSFSRLWRFPDALPTLWSVEYWQKSWQQLLEPLQNTAIIGVSSALIAVFICVLVLEWQSKRSQLPRGGWWIWVIYLPILVPQVSFLFGIQVLMVRFHLEGTLASVIWVHILFVFPYAYLTLAQVYLQFDARYLQQGAILCQSKWRAFVYIKIPMLFKPLAFSGAIAFAVSVAQYLPTLYVGAGRVNTVTLESVVLAGGSDSRISAVFALWQFILPLVVYIAALVIPQFVYRNRRGL
ncbi:MAG: hypothetical protein HRU05_15750 [Oceanospirillaceae bacterium]|nr:hypothetical protein [Oceanospirillaceae bacterium]